MRFPFIPAVLCLALSAAGPALSQAQPAPRSEAAPAGAASAAPARPAVDPVAEKFRRLQREMAQSEPAAGAPARATPASEAPEGVSIFSLSLKIVFGLAFVLVLAVVVIRVLKRAQGRMLAKGGGKASGEILEVLETCHLGPHQRVVALRMNGEVGIVGVTQQGMSLLTLLKEPAEEIRRQAVGPGNPAAFSDNLNKLLERFKRPKKVSDLLDEA